MAQYFYRDAEGNKHGPVSPATLKQMSQRGELTARTPIRKDGDEKWVRAGGIKALKSAIDGAKSPNGLAVSDETERSTATNAGEDENRRIWSALMLSCSSCHEKSVIVEACEWCGHSNWYADSTWVGDICHDGKFCLKCGEGYLTMPCPRCGTMNDANTLYYYNRGVELAEVAGWIFGILFSGFCLYLGLSSQ